MTVKGLVVDNLAALYHISGNKKGHWLADDGV